MHEPTINKQPPLQKCNLQNMHSCTHDAVVFGEVVLLLLLAALFHVAARANRPPTDQTEQRTDDSGINADMG